MRKLMMYAALAAPLFLAACGGNKSDSADSDTTMTDTAASTLPEVSTPSATVSNTVELTANDQMKYSTTEIRVKAGEQVTLTLKNVGTMPKESMGHNFLLLGGGTDVEAFATKAMVAKETDYIPADMKSSVMANTKLLGPGESATITFTVPAGTYDFICSFPGHYAQMRGKLIAE
ncbi:azurin [Flavihumibacter sp. R14]|nr:azurin [Flavihumibacter soli]